MAEQVGSKTVYQEAIYALFRQAGSNFQRMAVPDGIFEVYYQNIHKITRNLPTTNLALAAERNSL